MASAVIKRLSDAALRGEASRTGAEFARFISRISPHEAEGAIIGAYLACAVIDDSHTCLVLKDDNVAMAAEATGVAGLDTASVIEGVHSSRVVGRPGETRPLILEDERLYLHRYWSYERSAARRLLELSNSLLEPCDMQAAIRAVQRLFPPGPAVPDWQKIAAFNVLFRRLVVITGGPGTGKTRTAAALMALLLASEPERELSFAMCAPTGKAAARLTESAATAGRCLALDETIRQRMPERAQTVHRLLGAGREPGRFQFNRENPLPHDVVILDEASMIDLPMMVHLTDALRRDARLVLMGDKDQLASVEAGSVMRDLCSGAKLFPYSEEFSRRAALIGEDVRSGHGGAVNGLRDCIIALDHSYRFRPGSGIDELASAVNCGDFSQVKNILNDPGLKRARFISARREDLFSFLEREALPWARSLAVSSSLGEAMEGMDGLRILCGTKRGPGGVESVNRFMRDAVEHYEKAPGRTIFKGVPVIINRNNYMMELFNGDTGIAWPDESGRLKIWFSFGKTEMRSFSPLGLPSFDHAWAITVHRSQGSEFKKVVFILPSGKTAMPGRELLYTAVTRAREEITIWGTWEDLRACVENRTRRDSGLSMRLWGNS